MGLARCRPERALLPSKQPSLFKLYQALASFSKSAALEKSARSKSGIAASIIAWYSAEVNRLELSSQQTLRVLGALRV